MRTRVSAKRRDYLAIVEAAYSSCASDDDWVNGIAEAACPILDQGMGVHAWTYDVRDATAPRLCALGMADCRPGFERPAREFVEVLPPQVQRVFFPPSPPVELMHRVFTNVPATAEMVRIMQGAGVGDAVGLRGHNPDGRGLVLAAATPGLAELPPRMTWALTRIALHLAAAARLRFGGPAAARLDSADAVFTPRGRLEYLADPEADPAAARILPNAVERRLAANGVRADPKRALELWRALISGRWSIIDHADTDGKRFILAKRNEPGVNEPAALTQIERLVVQCACWGHSNKLIAYETGFSPATVSTQLRSALRKLRMRSRGDLVRLFAAAGQP